jgi:hypothetical protein
MNGIEENTPPAARQPKPATPARVKKAKAAPAPDAPHSALAAGKSGTLVARQVSMALNEWIAGVSPPQDPPFCRGAAFPDAEWSHFFRIFSVSTALAGTVVAGTFALPQLIGSVVPNAHSMKALVVFAFFAMFYSIYSRMFGIAITFRQSFFCFALVITPWFPFYILLKALGANLGVVWLLLMPGLWTYVFILVTRAIQIVSGARTVQVVLSLLLALVLAAVAFFSQVG